MTEQLKAMFDSTFETVLKSAKSADFATFSIPQFSTQPLRGSFTEYAGVVAGTAYHADGMRAGTFLGQRVVQGYDVFAVVPAHSNEVIPAEGCIEKDAAKQHVDFFAQRLNLPVHNFDFAGS